MEEFFAGLGAHEKTPTIFAVGDVKQSIYSFQGADPAVFGRMKSFFSEQAKSAKQNWKSIDLNVSFRSTQAVLAAANTA